MSDLLKRTQLIRRESFDPRKKAHIDSFKTFLRTGNWGDVQFYSELPYIEVPMTVLMKYSTYMLKVDTESRAERQERIEALDLQYFVEPTKAEKAEALARSNLLLNSMRREPAEAS